MLVTALLIAIGLVALGRAQILAGIALIALGCSNWAYKGWGWYQRRRREPQTDAQYARQMFLEAYLFALVLLIFEAGVLVHDLWLDELRGVDLAAMVGIALTLLFLYRVVRAPRAVVRPDQR